MVTAIIWSFDVQTLQNMWAKFQNSGNVQMYTEQTQCSNDNVGVLMLGILAWYNFTRHQVYLSLSHVTEWRKRKGGSFHMHHCFSPPSPLPLLVGWLAFVFVTVNKAQRYFDTFLLTLYCWFWFCIFYLQFILLHFSVTIIMVTINVSLRAKSSTHKMQVSKMNFHFIPSVHWIWSLAIAGDILEMLVKVKILILA